ncbi:hypothetical protein HDV05_004798 [Chytridiales sp. JEL 0842]|nr:hypothetical protein HDV05_004798 [Chytridiales sp. JEL 0842]
MDAGDKDHEEAKKMNAEDQVEAVTTTKDLSLRERLELELLEGTLECLVCVHAIEKRESIWSCDTCWAMMHLECVQDWAEKSGHAVDPDDEESDEWMWRCPGCQSQQSYFPDQRCFCGKQIDPEDNNYVMPHRTVSYTLDLLDLASKNISTLQLAETSFSSLLQPSSNKQFHNFPPMKSTQRQLIHLLADYYGIITESIDPEPSRSVVAQRVATSKIPKIPLSAALDLRRRGLLIIVDPETLAAKEKGEPEDGEAEVLEKLTASERRKAKKLAKPIPVPLKTSVRVANGFEALARAGGDEK